MAIMCRCVEISLLGCVEQNVVQNVPSLTRFLPTSVKSLLVDPGKSKVQCMASRIIIRKVITKKALCFEQDNLALDEKISDMNRIRKLHVKRFKNQTKQVQELESKVCQVKVTFMLDTLSSEITFLILKNCKR